MTTDPMNRGDWHKPQIRWTLKTYGWRQVSLITPVLWRWSLHIVLRLLPEGNWLVGVSFGHSSYDDDPYLQLGVGVACLEVNPMRIYTRREQIAMRTRDE